MSTSRLLNWIGDKTLLNENEPLPFVFASLMVIGAESADTSTASLPAKPFKVMLPPVVVPGNAEKLNVSSPAWPEMLTVSPGA